MNMTIDDILTREEGQTYDCKSFADVPVNVPVSLTETQRKAIEIIKSNLQITHRGLALMMYVTEKTAKRTTKTPCGCFDSLLKVLGHQMYNLLEL